MDLVRSVQRLGLREAASELGMGTTQVLSPAAQLLERPRWQLPAPAAAARVSNPRASLAAQPRAPVPWWPGSRLPDKVQRSWLGTQAPRCTARH